MGLTICQEIIRNCHGHISCFSEGENKGSTFSFSMKMSLPELHQGIHRDKNLLGELQAEVYNSNEDIICDASVTDDIVQKANSSINEIAPDDLREADLEDIK